MKNVCHLTSVHSRFDTRIFIKECKSLVDAGFDVSLVVADGKGNEVSSGISIFDVGKPKNRIERMLKTTKRVLAKARELNCGIYHLHDPELIPAGLKLKRAGKIVVFDSHEDVPKQIRSKSYMNPIIRKLVSSCFATYERAKLKNYDLIVSATPAIREKFAAWYPFTINVNNFPIIEEFCSNNKPYGERPKMIAYVGGITAIRGIKEIVKAMELCTDDVALYIAGEFIPKSLRNDIIHLPGWKKIKEFGFINRDEVKNLFFECRAGIVTFLPVDNHTDSQPNKMFEYMSVGLPVIASNFPLWRKIIEGSQCGICVDPTNPKAIASAIDWIFKHPKEADHMGRNGYKAVRDKYNWKNESIKLLESYKDLFNR